MPRGKLDDHKHAGLEKELADLRKEVAALKALLAKKSARGSGGADPRVDKLIEVLRNQHPRVAKSLDKAGL